MLCTVAPVFQRLPVALLLVSSVLEPVQKLRSPVIVGTAGMVSRITTLLVLVALQPAPFVTLTVYVPPVVTEMLCVVWLPGLQRFPVALLLVNVMLDPAQTRDGPVIIGVAGNVSTVTTVFVLVELHPGPVVTVTE